MSQSKEVGWDDSQLEALSSASVPYDRLHCRSSQTEQSIEKVTDSTSELVHQKLFGNEQIVLKNTTKFAGVIVQS